MTALLVGLLAALVVLLWPPPGRRTPSPSGRPGPPAPSPRWAGTTPPSGTRVTAGLPPAVGRPSLRWRRRDGPGRGTDDIADALLLVALALRAGLPLTAALHHVREGSTGRVGSDLAAVVAAFRWGLPSQEAWGYAGPQWRVAAMATHLSEETGAAAADLLEEAAHRMREEDERLRERAAARAGVLLVLPLGLGFLPAFACTAVVPLVATLASGVLSGTS